MADNSYESILPDADDSIDEESVMKILMATDIHLGFQHKEGGGVGANDSFVTFEEILQYAHEHEVDFVLLGGDLFHEAIPSQNTLLRCNQLLRKYCMGDRELKIEFLSQPEVVFEHCARKVVNYEDPNMNISLPIFSIHGNHDDPSLQAISTLDILSSTGFINYFGKYMDLSNIKITPLVIQKGITKVAIYGLSHINDVRLSRMLHQHKMNLLTIEEEDFFNILVLHQNRVPRCQHDYIPQDKLPKLLDFIMWGHEHECRINPEYVPENNCYISQPGSSIATSLCQGESEPKHVGILKIHGRKFKIEKLPLKTVRPFVFDQMFLSHEDFVVKKNQDIATAVSEYVRKYIEEKMIPEAAKLLTGHPRQPTQPLLRLRVHYENENQKFDVIELGQYFCDKVLNPLDMILFRKVLSAEKQARQRRRVTTGDVDPGSSKEPDATREVYVDDALEDMAIALGYRDSDDDDEASNLDDIPRKMNEYHSNPNYMKYYKVLSLRGMNKALDRFMKGDTKAFDDLVEFQTRKALEYLETCDIDFSDSKNIEKAMEPFVEQRDKDDDIELSSFFTRRDASSSQTSDDLDDISIMEPEKGRGTKV